MRRAPGPARAGTRRVVGLALAAALVAACSSGMAPSVGDARVIPTLGQFPDQQDRDSHACSVWARQENARASGVSGALGSFGGAVTGAGTPRYGWNQEGADRAYTTCMNSRGYSVYW